MQPGQSVAPGGAQENPSWQFNHESQPQAQQPAAQPTAASEPTPAPAASEPTPPVEDDDSAGVSWTASEFIAHAKSGGWYGLLALGTVVVGAGVYFLTGDRVSTVVIAIVAILFGIFAARQPRELQYVVNNKGITIGGKPYPFRGFRSFAIVQEGGVESIWFMPLKRFMP
ncbi:MAG: hypothetical protein ACXWLH_02300, partial [Candidatus Saccharimonadales bacterium]